MTRRFKRTSRRKNKNRRSVDIVTVPARGLFTGMLSGGVGTFSLQPTNLNSVAGQADSYAFYRITRLRYRLYPNGGGADLVAAYIAGVVDNAPTTVADLSVTEHSVIYGDDVTIPTSWRNVPKRALASYNVWYKTVVGSPTPSDELQGQIYLAGGTTDQWKMELEATYQFKSLVATSATPQERGHTEMLLQRQMLLRIMGLSPAPAVAASSPPSK